MRLAGGVRIGAYLCPRGAFVVECGDAAAGVEVRRVLDVPLGLRNAGEAADHLVSVLQSGGITRARVSVAVRGFGVAHHTLQLPPAPDSVLDPVVEREMRRLEPHLGDCVVQWMALPAMPDPLAGPGAATQRTLFATAAPRELVDVLEERLRAAGHRLEHLTTLPVAAQRLLEQFDSCTGTVATVTALPDAAYIAFSIEGGVRLIVEPPLPQDGGHEAAALGEELELAVTFVRQQFRGNSVDRVVLIGTRPSPVELRGIVAERLAVPVKQIEAETLAPASLIGLGAVIDASAERPQSLGGATRATARSPGHSRLQSISLAAVLVLALVGMWTTAEAVRAWRAGRALETAQRRVQQDDFGLAPLRATAEQRRLVSLAVEAVQVSWSDRAALQSVLAGVAAAMPAPVRLDSLRLAWDGSVWRAIVTGGITSSSNARAVQLLHNVYRDVPQRVGAQTLRLDRLTYGDDADDAGAGGMVRFQLSFAVPSRAGGAR